MKFLLALRWKNTLEEYGTDSFVGTREEARKQAIDWLHEMSNIESAPLVVDVSEIFENDAIEPDFLFSIS